MLAPPRPICLYMLASPKTYTFHPVHLACFEVKCLVPERLIVLRILFFNRVLPVKIELFLLNKNKAHPFWSNLFEKKTSFSIKLWFPPPRTLFNTTLPYYFSKKDPSLYNKIISSNTTLPFKKCPSMNIDMHICNSSFSTVLFWCSSFQTVYV